METLDEIDNYILKDWPLDWEIHIARAFRAYFQDKDDSQEVAFDASVIDSQNLFSADYNIDKSSVKIYLKLKDLRWHVAITFDENIIANLSYVLALCKVNEEAEKLGIHIYPSGKIYRFIGTHVKSFVEDNILTLIKGIEQEIWDDYWKRSNDGEDPEKNPKPITPVNSTCGSPVATC